MRPVQTLLPAALEQTGGPSSPLLRQPWYAVRPGVRSKLYVPKAAVAQPKRAATSISNKPYWKAAQRQRKGFPKKKVEQIRRHLYSAAYRYAGKGYSGLFGHLGNDGNQYLDPDEFYRFMRRVLRLPPKAIADADIATLFRSIDKSGSGTVQMQGIVAFANNKTAEGKYTGSEDLDSESDDDGAYETRELSHTGPVGN